MKNKLLKININTFSTTKMGSADVMFHGLFLVVNIKRKGTRPKLESSETRKTQETMNEEHFFTKLLLCTKLDRSNNT